MSLPPPLTDTLQEFRLHGGDVPTYPRNMTQRLAHWASKTSQQPFLAERQEGPHRWRTLTFGEALPQVKRLAQALIDHGLSTERPLMVLSGNSIEHALLACAAMHVGIPYVPVSPSYALLSEDFVKLRHVVELVTPGMLFVDEEARFSRALAAVCDNGVTCVAKIPAQRALTFDSLVSTPATHDVENAHARVTPDTIAKLLFTSGSTGMPKAVINTHRMLCSNQTMLAKRQSFLERHPPVLVDWLPWHHTFGGNTILGMAIHNGGALYIDDGNPTAQGVQRTIENLREVSPTFYCNVPKGFEALVEHLRNDDSLREAFFHDLQMLHFGGAVLPAHVRAALEALGKQTRGAPVPMLTGLGSTEACLAFCTEEPSDTPGLIGHPVPGMTVKLVAKDDKWEARLKGLNITPGYWRDKQRTNEAFDHEGYYCTGDAMRLIDPDHPERGLIFDGRLSENFKLVTGTWVNVGTLRLHLVEHFAPLAQDIVVVGEGRDYLTGIVVLNLPACQQQLGSGKTPLEVLAADPNLQQWFAKRLATHCRGQSSSMRLERLLLLDQPLSVDRGELTDKGSVNQRLVRERYTDLVACLYAEPPQDPRIILPSTSPAS
ncbi:MULTISPECIES: feruloyl-CoA synthase [unclassified Halomonas]|uniref:feruloyl-CoA synthase n=1 Tax=unclassified Halomonas TaxID=2609666 RepID=UPI0006DA0491|nr:MULTISPECIES: feruloyl-CoA synthase [unclassified Halomonas]KPQ30882.1 MAG: feruloyl-CoA synthase [Halomonas sp. HL-93]SBR52771.1 4-coumarate--CoA ligase [Halomonas sp. HL-93]SNY97832.1 4-coumarate--CoA ligase [Halomonas sp. hl-4]